MAILTCCSMLVDQTSSSSSSDSRVTPRKKAYRNSCKNLSAIRLSDPKLWPFWPVTQVLHVKNSGLILLAHLLLFLVIMQHWNIFFLRKILRLDWFGGFCYLKNLISQSKTRKTPKMLSQITCQDWQQIRDLTSHQSMTAFLTNLYFLSLQCLGMLILLIFLFQDNCRLIGVPKTKESSWTK